MAAVPREYDHIRGWLLKLRSDCPQLQILVIGETGVGKSTLVNNLLGEDVADVGNSMTSATTNVNCYEGVIEGVPVKVYDTPGLADSRSDRDDEYLEKIKKLINLETIHLIIYCLKMTETRMRRSIIRTFQQYTTIGVDWRRAVIALTFSDVLKAPAQVKKQRGFSESRYFKDRLEAWRVEIPQVLAAETHLEETDVKQIKINPTTGDNEEPLPSGEDWYIPFWLDVLEVLPPAAKIRFVDIHRDNITYGDKEKRVAPEWPDNFCLPPPPEEPSPPPYKTSTVPTSPPPLQANVAAKEPTTASVRVCNQDPDMGNLPISLLSNPSKLTIESTSCSSNAGTKKQTRIVLESGTRDRFEKTLGEAVQTAAGVATGGMLGAAAGTIAVVGTVAAGTLAAPLIPVVAVGAAVGAAVGVLGAGVAKLFGLW